MSEKLETGSYVYLIAGGLPLLVYPLIFLTFMMNMGIPRTGDESIWALLISTTFQSVSLAYPFVYVPSLLGAMSAAKHKDEKKERKYAKSAFYYFIFTCVLFLASSLFGAN